MQISKFTPRLTYERKYTCINNMKNYYSSYINVSKSIYRNVIYEKKENYVRY